MKTRGEPRLLLLPAGSETRSRGVELREADFSIMGDAVGSTQIVGRALQCMQSRIGAQQGQGQLKVIFSFKVKLDLDLEPNNYKVETFVKARVGAAPNSAAATDSVLVRPYPRSIRNVSEFLLGSCTILPA